MTALNLILASNSPRRRELLGWTGLSFTVRPIEIDESSQPGETPAAYVSRLALAKGRTAADIALEGSLVLAADTIVADEFGLLGKPAGSQDAAAMLRRLRGRNHQVFTALAVIDLRDRRVETDLCCSNVPMREYSDAEIDSYVASGDPLDKAGAYAIQHPGFHPVLNFSGCFASVMGLPLCHLARCLARLDIALPNNIPSSCQAGLAYACPIYPAVLRGDLVG
jgi:septum formation protein